MPLKRGKKRKKGGPLEPGRLTSHCRDCGKLTVYPFRDHPLQGQRVGREEIAAVDEENIYRTREEAEAAGIDYDRMHKDSQYRIEHAVNDARCEDCEEAGRQRDRAEQEAYRQTPEYKAWRARVEREAAERDAEEERQRQEQQRQQKTEGGDGA